MKLKLTTDRDVNSQAFRPGDSVQVMLQIQGCKPTSIGEVTARFSGMQYFQLEALIYFL